MSILDGGLQQLFGTIFASFFLNASILKVTQVDDGEGGFTETTQTYPAKVQVDQYSDLFRATAGISDKSVKLIILQDGLTIDLAVNDQLQVFNDDGTQQGPTYKLLDPITQDPAKVGWVAQGTPLNG